MAGKTIQPTPRILPSREAAPLTCPFCGSTAVSFVKVSHRCGIGGGQIKLPATTSPVAPGPGFCQHCGRKQIFYKIKVCHNCCKFLP